MAGSFDAHEAAIAKAKKALASYQQKQDEAKRREAEQKARDAEYERRYGQSAQDAETEKKEKKALLDEAKATEMALFGIDTVDDESHKLVADDRAKRRIVSMKNKQLGKSASVVKIPTKPSFTQYILQRFAGQEPKSREIRLAKDPKADQEEVLPDRTFIAKQFLTWWNADTVPYYGVAQIKTETPERKKKSKFSKGKESQKDIDVWNESLKYYRPHVSAIIDGVYYDSSPESQSDFFLRNLRPDGNYAALDMYFRTKGGHFFMVTHRHGHNDSINVLDEERVKRILRPYPAIYIEQFPEEKIFT